MIDNSRLKINTKDIRACRFFFRYIQNAIPNARQYAFDGNNPDTSLSVRIINDVLESYIPNREARVTFIKGMELALSIAIQPEKNFSWLAEDKRATFWLWGSLYLDPSFNHSINEALESPSNINWYHRADLSVSPENHYARYDVIVALFDFICIENGNIPKVRKWIYEKMLYWRKHAVQLTKFKWLNPEETETCLWAFLYIKKYQEETACNNNSLNPVNLPAPLNSEEVYHTFYAMLDLWEVANETQQKAITKINKAFYQKNFRRKQAAKRGREDISKEHVERLDSLVRYYRSDKASVIEMLIDERLRGIETKLSRRH